MPNYDENDGKVLVSIVALVRVPAKNESEAATIGGNLARKISADIPGNYDVVGVEVQGTGEGVPEDAPKTARANARKAGEPAIAEDTRVLKT